MTNLTADPADDNPQPIMESVIDLYTSLETRYERLRHAYACLMKRHAELDEQLRTLHDIHVITDLEGSIVQVNRIADAIAPTHRLLGSNLADWVEAASREHFQTIKAMAARDGYSDGETWELRLQCDDADAHTMAVAAQVLPVRIGQTVATLHWVLRDVSPLLDLTSRYSKPLVAFERVAEGVMMTDPKGNIVSVNAAFTRITGYPAQECIGRNPRFLQSGLQDKAFYRDFWLELNSAGSWQGHVFNRKKSGEIYSEWMRISSTRDAAGAVICYTAVFYQLSEESPAPVCQTVDTLAQPLEPLSPA